MVGETARVEGKREFAAAPGRVAVDRGHAGRIHVLDPAGPAVTAPGQSAVGSPAYVADRLLVDPSADLDVVMTALAPALAELGWMVASVDEPRRTDVKQVARREYRGHVTLTIEQGKERLTTVPDAWVALQHLALADPRLAALVHLDHLVAACPGYWDGIAGYWDGIAGYWDGIAGYWDGIAGSSQAPAEFGRPGFGGKAPVSLVLAAPARAVGGEPGGVSGISARSCWIPAEISRVRSR